MRGQKNRHAVLQGSVGAAVKLDISACEHRVVHPGLSAQHRADPDRLRVRGVRVHDVAAAHDVVHNDHGARTRKRDRRLLERSFGLRALRAALDDQAAVVGQVDRGQQAFFDRGLKLLGAIEGQLQDLIGDAQLGALCDPLPIGTRLLLVRLSALVILSASRPYVSEE